ncbi:hypothetical protein JCM10449v2_007750 [Rhodotorula kratochvilovae]
MRTPSSSLPIPPSFTTGEQPDPLNANYRVWRAREGDAALEEGGKSEPPEGGGADALPLSPGDGAGGPAPSTSAAAIAPAPAAPTPALAPPPPPSAPAPAPVAGTSAPADGARSSSAPRKVRRYTSAEDLLVASYRREGLSAAAIGEKLGRSTNSIYNRLTALDSMGVDVTPRKKPPAPAQAKGKAGEAQ